MTGVTRAVRINRTAIHALSAGQTPRHAEYFGHALMLVEKLGIVFRLSTDGGMCRADGTIEGPMPDDAASLATFMHEVGHRETAAQGPFRGVTVDGVFQSPNGESLAWLWAIERGGKWTAPMQDSMVAALGSYADLANDDELDEMISVIRRGSLSVQGPPWARDFVELGWFVDQFRAAALEARRARRRAESGAVVA